jgi:hypothetical protein
MFKTLAMVLAVAGSMAIAGRSMADKIVLKDGTVLEGKITREGDKFYFITVKIGGIEENKFVNRDDVKSVQRDDPTPKTDEAIKKAEEAKEAAAKDESRHDGATRICILNFGPPSEWQGQYENEVGVEISSQAFKDVVPMLEKAKVDVVVIRVNSGGGYGLEADRFRDLFVREYKPHFRTVAWIESAISAAAMSPWVIDEMYFFRKGNIGACTGWYGPGIAVKGAELEEMLFKMEKASAFGKKDPAIMRAMQIMEPLSVDVDDNGEVHWRQDEDGQFVLNKRGHIFTMTASEAMKFKFGRGIADTKEELVKVMGIQEAEFVAQDASDYVDKSIRENDAVDKHNKVVFQKYQLAMSLAEQLQDKERRGIELAKARRLLNEIRGFVKLNPNFQFHMGIDLSPEWFKEQEEEIKRLASLP